MTWSVLAVDATTGATAIAVASCVPLDVVLEVPGLAPGRGAVVTQSYLLDGERERALALLDGGASPATVLAALVDPTFDPAFELRQLVIADVGGSVASFTGAEALPFAGHAVVRVGRVSVAVQGNLLTGREVIDTAILAARSDAPCDVAARALVALEAGGADGRGDSRCTPLGRAAEAATLRGDGFVVDATLDEPGAGDDVLALLRARFEAARVERPCPSRAEGVGEGGEGAESAEGGAGGAASRASVSQASHAGCSLANATTPAESPASFALVGLGLAALAISRRRRRRPCPSVRCRSPR